MKAFFDHSTRLCEGLEVSTYLEETMPPAVFTAMY
jgi:hypothetical protein